MNIHGSHFFIIIYTSYKLLEIVYFLTTLYTSSPATQRVMTALQGGLVLTNSGRLKLGDNIL